MWNDVVVMPRELLQITHEHHEHAPLGAAAVQIKYPCCRQLVSSAGPPKIGVMVPYQIITAVCCVWISVCAQEALHFAAKKDIRIQHNTQTKVHKRPRRLRPARARHAQASPRPWPHAATSTCPCRRVAASAATRTIQHITTHSPVGNHIDFSCAKLRIHRDRLHFLHERRDRVHAAA